MLKIPDIFNGDGLFTHTIEQMSERDGSNTHEVLQAIFRAMNIKVAERVSRLQELRHIAHHHLIALAFRVQFYCIRILLQRI